MARAHFVTYALDSEGRPISGVTCTVRELDTTTAIAETIYDEDDTAGNTTKANPFTGTSEGKVELWLENPKIVDLYIQKTGYDAQTIRANVSQLTASTLVFKDAGTPMTQRAGVNFEDGFVLTDDAANDETEVDLDYGGTAEVADVAAAEGAGVSSKVARADHAHAHPSGLGANLHHNQSHAHDGADSSGTVAHGDLTGAGTDDHHAKSHVHDGADGSGSVSHDDLTDLTTGDPHTQYQLESGHTLAAHEALLLASEADLTTAVSDHAALPNAHHAQAHDADDHTAQVYVASLASDDNFVASTTNLGINWDTEDLDVGFGATVGGSIILPATGKYRVTAQVRWEGANDGVRAVIITLDGDESPPLGEVRETATANAPMIQNVTSRVFQATAGMYVTVHAYHTSSTNPLQVIGTSGQTWVSIEYLGA